jgi:hypothetical protein
VALGLAGSLISVGAPRVGGALLLAALISIIADERLGVSPGRRLTPERASQNVVSTPRRDQEPGGVHLIITANYDAGRKGVAYRTRARTWARRLQHMVGPLAPGWLGWLVIAHVWLILTAIVRLGGDRGAVIGLVQLVPTVALVIALALLVELASSDYGPAATDNGSGVAIALALARALDAAPPRRLSVELVLQGAGDGFGIGLRRYLRSRRRTLTPTNAVVLGIAPSGSGTMHWWISDGQLFPLRYFARLRALCERIAAGSQPDAKPHRGRGATPAGPARSARLPAITIGCLDDNGLPAGSHQAEDKPNTVHAEALDATVHFGLLLADEIDSFLRERRSDRRDRVAFRRPLAMLGGREREPPDQFRP